VVYRKGQLSKGMMDRQWPHQVALRAMRVPRPQLHHHPPFLRAALAVSPHALVPPR